MNTYLVRRPHCNPSQLVVIAKTKKKAIKLANTQYGFAENTTATIKNKEGIILNNYITNSITNLN